jgi:hypothetical protein
MKKNHWIVAGISIPLAFFGLFVLVITINVVQIDSDSDKWMVELEPHLDLTEGHLLFQMRNEDVGQQLQIHKVRHLDDFIKNFPSDIHGQLEDANLIDNRYVLYIEKKSHYSHDEIREMLIGVDGIKNAEIVSAWILGKNSS